MTQIPRIVNRLLDALNQGSLAGDIAEQLAAGRSPAWVWWQISGAVVSGVVNELRRYPYLTFRAVAIGWITFQIVQGQLPFSPHLEVKMWIAQSRFAELIAAFQYFASGWVVARFHRPHWVAMVAASTFFLMLGAALAWGIRAWMWARVPESPSLDVFVLHALIALALPLASILGGVVGGFGAPRPTHLLPLRLRRWRD